jgi:predicted RNA-binding protein with PIN domain
MTNADSISEKLCQAIELIAEKKVSTANYDRTIQATIVSC